MFIGPMQRVLLDRPMSNLPEDLLTITLGEPETLAWSRDAAADRADAALDHGGVVAS